ncbi:MAG: 1-deoxy-D-xylulose-5-phosphate reductoisomerase [Firmicutes bacterium]|nr:1-deoxy-D-xylulose-5-phosphate reductoisomerase [Bacillota bacterium]
MSKRVAVLGSTGSVGRQALEVVEHLGLSVVGLVAGKNRDLLAEQIGKYRPQWAVLAEGDPLPATTSTRLAYGREAVAHFARWHGADIVIAAISGIAGLLPTWNAVLSGATVALANKESLVTAGELIQQAATAAGATIISIDSEHSAIWQCLQGVASHHVQRLLLTASGGPFRDWDRSRLDRVTVAEALAHPTWKMGKKITIDSATLMNKGLEIIEAHWLFGIPYDNIEVVIHPESIVHSLVELVDGSLLAHLSMPDMRLPIQVALTYPERVVSSVGRLSLEQIGKLTFAAPRQEDFPCLKLAVEAGRAGRSYPIVLNAANEVAVEAFLASRIGFMDIPRLVAQALDQHNVINVSDIDMVLMIDREAREKTWDFIGK